MKPLWVKGISGIYNELYEPNSTPHSSKINVISEQMININDLFWSDIFSHENITSANEQLEQTVKYLEYQMPQFQAILADKHKFYDKVKTAYIAVCDCENSRQDFFEHIENLTIQCEVYSKVVYQPFRLTIQDGFILNQLSSLELLEACNSYTQNPYFRLIEQVVFPCIIEYRPSILFYCGRVDMVAMTLATLLHRYDPKAVFCVTRHASEYYSMNKISNYLNHWISRRRQRRPAENI